MADTKISTLSSATTPLAGTEVLPLVQSATTKKVSVADVTAGRDIDVRNLTVGLGGTANNTTSITLNGTSNASSGSYLLWQRNGSNAWFIGDTSAALGSGAGYITWIYVATHYYLYINCLAALTVDTSRNLKLDAGSLVIGTAGKGLEFSGDGGLLWRCGAGTPDGAVSAPVGSLYTRTNGGAGTPEVLDALATVAGGVALIGWYEVAA